MDGGVEWMGVRWNSTHVPCIAICEVWIGATTPLHITHNPTHTFLVNNADGWMREIVITDVWLYQAAHICFTSILVLELSNGGDPHTEGTAWQQRRQQQQQHCLPLHRLNVCVYGCVCMEALKSRKRAKSKERMIDLFSFRQFLLVRGEGVLLPRTCVCSGGS
ncbi:hypothetical protein EGR_07140 [Echinococcus granulosus]|uniref:Uncharacterized protein n=1 Tax=Echinococcus granulosus TaxID=6210 RepID=W6UX07_ECHGR|nr:hypothetical protein EGR_07140 [Echinococcus granulosus]EUB58034.1 hypothetical protein EGR_07140 [Echinococcus granulosus]